MDEKSQRMPLSVTVPATVEGLTQPTRTPLLREAIGEALRHYRNESGRTLRSVAAEAMVSPGYLSEIERGRKEASSELLAAVCQALSVSIGDILLRIAAELIAVENRVRNEVSLLSTV